MTSRVSILIGLTIASIAGLALAIWSSLGAAAKPQVSTGPFDVPAIKGQGTLDAASLATLSAIDLRRLASDIKAAPQQRAQAIHRIAQARDWDGVETLIAQLDDSSALVRGRSAAALRHILGTEFFYRAEEERSRRLQSIQNLRRYWDARKDSPPLQEKTK